MRGLVGTEESGRDGGRPRLRADRARTPQQDLSVGLVSEPSPTPHLDALVHARVRVVVVRSTSRTARAPSTFARVKSSIQLATTREAERAEREIARANHMQHPAQCPTCHAAPKAPCVYAAGGIHTSRLLSVPREQCEVRGEGCEVFTRCVLVTTPNGAVNACPTCASARVV